MIRHVLLLAPRAGVEPAAIAACKTALSQLVGRIPGLVDCHWGENLAAAERRENFTHGFSMDFADRASLEAYGPHPEHRQAAQQVRNTFERVLVFDIEL